MPLIAALVIAMPACGVRTPALAVTRPRAAEVTALASNAPSPDPTSIQGRALQALRGLTVAEARRRLRALGHTGNVTVGSVVRFDPTCGFDKVCETNRDGGCSAQEDLALLLNAKQEISGPRE